MMKTADRKLQESRRAELKGDASMQARIAAVGFGIGALAYWLDGPKWAVAGLVLVAAIFLLKAAFNFLLTLRTDVTSSAPAARVAGDDAADDDVTRRVVPGGDLRAFDFTTPSNLDGAPKACAEAIFRSISADLPGFARKFVEYRKQNQNNYPDQAEILESMQIERIEAVDTGKGKCTAYVYFDDPAGEVFYATVDEDGFGELIWI
jgi:hypothetical protein